MRCGCLRSIENHREQVEMLYRGGANTVGKQHFTLLYQRARNLAFTSRNIRSDWAKTGLYPFDPEKGLREVRNSQDDVVSQTLDATTHISSQDGLLPTPVTAESLVKIEQETTLDSSSRHRIRKLANAAEKAFADRAILLDENQLLFEQNNEKTTRVSIRSTVVGNAKVMSWDDILEAQRKRDMKAAATPATRRGGHRTRGRPRKPQCSRAEEVEASRREIEELGLEQYCSILLF